MPPSVSSGSAAVPCGSLQSYTDVMCSTISWQGRKSSAATGFWIATCQIAPLMAQWPIDRAKAGGKSRQREPMTPGGSPGGLCGLATRRLVMSQDRKWMSAQRKPGGPEEETGARRKALCPSHRGSLSSRGITSTQSGFVMLDKRRET